MDDKRIIELLNKGDESAFDAVFKKYSPDVYYFSLDLMKSKPDAEEVLQETFLKVWETRKTIDPELNFRYYLITIAKNKIYNIFRRRIIALRYNKIVAAAEDSALPYVENDLYIEDMQKLLLGAVGRLTPHQKEVMTLKSMGLSNDEIAERLGVAKKTIEYHLGKAYKQLRSDLDIFRDILGLLLPLIYCLL